MSPPGPVDFFDIRALLDDDERLIRDTVARFVDREVAPLMAECFATERFPIELVARLAELGLFGATLRGYGCAGLATPRMGSSARSWNAETAASAAACPCRAASSWAAIFACGSEEQRCDGYRSSRAARSSGVSR